jgi:hypothetical protein
LILAPANEFLKDMPKRAMQLAAKHGGGVPIVQLRGPDGGPRKFVPALHTFACTAHRRELEHLAAGAPSSYHVELRRGPAADRPIVQVRA